MSICLRIKPGSVLRLIRCSINIFRSRCTVTISLFHPNRPCLVPASRCYDAHAVSFEFLHNARSDHISRGHLRNFHASVADACYILQDCASAFFHLRRSVSKEPVFQRLSFLGFVVFATAFVSILYICVLVIALDSIFALARNTQVSCPA